MLTLLALLALVLLLAPAAPRCLEYRSALCLRCTPSHRLLGGRCLPPPAPCAEPTANGGCLRCVEGWELRDEKCVGLPTLYQLAYAGGDDYLPVDPTAAGDDPFFVVCDGFIRKGEYSHFVSRTVRPYRFIGLQSGQQWSTYRIVYEGSGGGLLLSIVGVERSTRAVVIKALVTIGTSQVVEGCVDYEEGGGCRSCSSDQHLEEGVCYPNISGCVSHFRNLCLACEDYALLIENRCLFECGAHCDTAHIVFYQNRHLA